MNEPIRYIQVVTTVDDSGAAEKIAAAVIEQRLAACVQISQCRSVFRWEGRIDNEKEYLCVMKSRSDLFARLEEAVRNTHPYEVPEILATEICAGGADYLAWLEQELSPRQDG